MLMVNHVMAIGDGTGGGTTSTTSRPLMSSSSTRATSSTTRITTSATPRNGGGHSAVGRDGLEARRARVRGFALIRILGTRTVCKWRSASTWGPKMR